MAFSIRATRALWRAAAAALFLAASIAPRQAWSLEVSQQVQRRLAVATQRLTLTHQSDQVDAFAKVLDPEPLVQLDSDLATAIATAAASKAEAERSRVLSTPNGGVAVKDMEAAVSQARQDALKVDILRRRLGLEWGPGVARMSDVARERLVRALTAGAAALVHVDTHNNEGQRGAKFVKVDIGDDSVRGRVIGPARAAEPRLQSSGLIVEVEGRSAILLSVGLTQSAHIEQSTPQSGVLLPRTSVIRFKGSDWAYVRVAPTTFQRRLAENPVPESDGLFVAKGFAAGDEVVVKGADALFAAELSPPAETH
jgi:hypothetical protein